MAIPYNPAWEYDIKIAAEIKRIGNAERISVVCYFRKKMTQCGSAEEELERVKHA